MRASGRAGMVVVATAVVMDLGCTEVAPSAGRSELTDAASEGDASSDQAASEAQDGGWSTQDASDSEAATNVHEPGCMGRRELRFTLGTGGAGVWGFGEASEAELDAAVLPNGCLPQDKVWNDCCEPALREAELRDGACCYDFAGVSCC